MVTRSQRGSLAVKILLRFFVPTAILLVVVALVNFQAYQQVTAELVIERDQEVTRLSANQLAEELGEYTDLLTTLARTIAAYRENLRMQADALKAASNRLVVFDGGTVLLDTFGMVLASEPERPEIQGQDWSGQEYYLEVLRSQIATVPRPAFSDVVVEGPGGTPVVGIAVPVISEQEEFLGVLVGMFRLGSSGVSAFYGDIVKLRLGASGRLYLVDSADRVIYHPEAALIGEDFSDHAVLQQLATGDEETKRIRTREGENIVASMAPVPETPWRLVVEESWSALTLGSRRYQAFLILLLALGVVVPTLAVAVAARRFMRPINALIGAAQEVAKGNFGQSISAHTGDEIEELAKQFNLMSAQLQESYATLEERVRDRTRELATLNAIAAVAGRSLDLSEILNSALDKTLEVMGIESGGVYLLQAEEQVLTIAAYRGFDPSFVAAIDRLELGEGFSGRVVQTGEPVIINDLASDPRLTRSAVREAGFHAVASLPLVSRGKTLGTLFVVTRGFREFTLQEVELLTSIGLQIGGAVENARLFAQAESRLKELEALYRADERMYRYLQMDQVLQALVDVSVEILQAEKSAVLVWDDHKRKWVIRVARGFSSKALATLTNAWGNGVPGRVGTTGEPALIEDAQLDPLRASVPKRVLKAVDGEGLRSFMHLPITIKGQVFGVFNVSYTRPHAYGKDELRLFTALAQRAAIAIENAQLYERTQELAVVEERQRLARDLHDAVTQTLFSASLIAEVLPRIWERNLEEGRKRLEELRQLTRGALAEMRTLLIELRPAALAEAELRDLLRQLAEAIVGRSRVEVVLKAEGDRPLPAETKVAFYRIAQEALNNVAKHSGASRATLELECGAERVTLKVEDNGRGFDPTVVSAEHLGLGIMRERSEAIGAELTLESAPGRGTRVTVTWPGKK